MITMVWMALGVLGLAALFVLGSWISAIRTSRVLRGKLREMIQPAIKAVREDHPSANEIVAKLAEDPVTRNSLFAGLKEIGKAEIFPPEFRSIEKIAESDLATWLRHPHELGVAPCGMELVRIVPVDGGAGKWRVCLFRFRVEPPHWAARCGWMAGISGPFLESGEPVGAVSGTFSELTPIERLPAEEHVRQLMQKRGLVVSC